MRIRVAIALLATASLGNLPADAQSCDFVGFVDPCQQMVQVVPKGGTGTTAGTYLDAMPHGAHPATGMSWATVPGYGHKFVFVSQGPYLHVVNLELPQPVHTVNVATEAALPLVLGTVHAAAPITVQGNTIYEVYVGGHLDVGYGITVPWMMVLDQQTLLAGGPSPVLGSIGLCTANMFCVGDAVDVEASVDLGGANPRRIETSVLFYENDFTTRTHRFMTVERNSGAQGYWTVSFNPALEDTPWTGSVDSAMGIDFDGSGVDAEGVFQSASTTVDLATGTQSCALTGDPTDVGVWSAPAHFDHDTFHFVTSVDATQDKLLVYPEGTCPSSEPIAVSINVGNTPVAMDYRKSGPDVWAYTANTNSLTLARMQIKHHSGSGDSIHVFSTETDIFGGMCPTEIVFRDPGETYCIDGDPPGGPPGDCGLDPDDADCEDYCEEIGDPIEVGENGGGCALTR